LRVKKVLIAILVLLLLIAAVVGLWYWRYDEKPDQALLRTVACATLGDEEGFLDGFSDDSRGLVSAVMALSRGEDLSKSPRHPYYYLATENIVSVEHDAVGEARVRVRRPGDDKSKGYDIPMVRQCEAKYLILDKYCLLPQWKIDAKRFDAKPMDAAKDR
jgi:hypothetical protein